MSQLLQSSIWQKIGYSGYSELVFAYGNKHSSISFPENFSNEEKDEFIRLLSRYREKRIMVLGSGFSQNIANHFSEMLNLYGFRATANSHLEFLRENVEKDVLIFIVSNSGDTLRLAELVKLAKIIILISLLSLVKRNPNWTTCYTNYKHGNI